MRPFRAGGGQRTGRAHCRHRCSRAMTRRNARRQDGLHSRWHGLRFAGAQCSSHPGL